MKKNVSLAVILSLCLVDISTYAEVFSGPIPAPQAQALITADPSRLEPPMDFVDIEEIYKGSGRALIVHIQDPHANLSGQQNIAGALERLMRKYGISLILSEGGQNDCSLTPLKKIASGPVWKRLAKSFLVQGKISGEEYLNLTSDVPMKIVGLEDMGLYSKSVMNYGKLADSRQSNLEYIAKIRRAVQSLKQKTFPPKVLAYEKERGLGAFSDKKSLLTLVRLAEGEGIGLLAYPNLSGFIEVLKKEESLDFDAAQLEQAAVLDELSKKGAESEMGELREIVSRPSAELSQYVVFRAIARLAEEKGVALTKYEQFSRYGEYLRRFTELDLKVLLDEFQAIEQEVYRRLLTREDDRLLRSVDRYLELLGNAYEIRMTTDEFNLFTANESEFKTMPMLAFLNKKLTDSGFFGDLVTYDPSLDKGRDALISFYASVSDRDFAFVRNVEASLSSEKQEVAVLISGGYHTPHLKKLLREKGYSYVVLTPRVTRETNQKRYEQRLLSPFRKRIERVDTETMKTQVALTAQKKLASAKAVRQDGVREMLAAAVPALVLDWAAQRGITEAQLTADRGRYIEQYLAETDNQIVLYELARDAAMAMGVEKADAVSLAAQVVVDKISEISRVRVTEAGPNVDVPGVSGARLAIGVDLPTEVYAKLAAPVANLPADTQPLERVRALNALLKAQRPAEFLIGGSDEIVGLHLDSHNGVVQSLLMEGRLDERTAVLMTYFAEFHDLAYSGTEVDLTRAEKENGTEKEAILDAFTQNGLAAGLDPTEARARAQATFEFLLKHDAGPTRELVRKILGHGSLSAVVAVKRFQALGLSSDQARGLAVLFSSHHPGFPIDFVKNIVLKNIPSPLFQGAAAEITAKGLDPILLIDQSTSTPTSADDLRRALALRAAELLGVRGEGVDTIVQASALAYGFDRIVPGNGEWLKRAKVITSNITDFSALVVSEIYSRNAAGLIKEADAGVNTAKYFGFDNVRSMLEDKTRLQPGVPNAEVVSFIETTQRTQASAVAFLETLRTQGFSGHVADAAADFVIIDGIYQETRVIDPNFATVQALRETIRAGLLDASKNHVKNILVANLGQLLYEYAKNGAQGLARLGALTDVDAAATLLPTLAPANESQRVAQKYYTSVFAPDSRALAVAALKAASGEFEKEKKALAEGPDTQERRSQIEAAQAKLASMQGARLATEAEALSEIARQQDLLFSRIDAEAGAVGSGARADSFQAFYGVSGRLPQNFTVQTNAADQALFSSIAAQDASSVLGRGVLPITVSTGFTGAEFVKQRAGYRVDLNDPTGASAETAAVTLGAAALRQAAPAPAGTETADPIVRMALDEAAAGDRTSKGQLRRLVSRLNESKTVIYTLGVESQDPREISRVVQLLKQEFKDASSKLNVLIEFADKDGKRLENFEGMQSDALSAEIERGAKRFFSGVRNQGIIDRAAELGAGYLPVQQGVADAQNFNVMPHEQYIRAAIAAAVTDAEDEILQQMVKSLTKASRVSANEIQFLQKVAPGTTAQAYEDKGLIVRALQTLSQELYRAYVAFRAVASSA